MRLSYTDILGDGERHETGATVTTDHAASSYGQPVIVLDTDGEALDITSWILLNYQIVEATPEEFDLLKRVLILDPQIVASYAGVPDDGNRITSRDAQALVKRETGETVPISSITHACRRGHIRGAVKSGRDWMFPELEFWRWLNNRPKPGRVPGGQP